MARSRPSPTPSRCSARSSASTRGVGTPAAARTAVASRTASARLEPLPAVMTDGPGPFAGGGGPGLFVQFDCRLDPRFQVPVHDLVKVVGLVSGAVVRDPVFRVVVGAD